MLCHFQVAKVARFGTKPAGILEVIGKNVALELLPLAVAKQSIELWRCFDSWNQVFLRCPACLNRRMQREPVLGVRSKRDDVSRFSDPSKQIAAENFHRHISGET